MCSVAPVFCIPKKPYARRAAPMAAMPENGKGHRLGRKLPARYGIGREGGISCRSEKKGDGTQGIGVGAEVILPGDQGVAIPVVGGSLRHVAVGDEQHIGGGLP